MDSLQYYPGSWDRLTITVMGLLIAFLAITSIALVVARRNGLADRTQALANGASLGLAIGLAGGIGFLALQSRIGGPDRFLAPLDVRTAVITGVALGLLTALAACAFITTRSAAALGLLLGTLAGLAIFRLIFGPTAGFGGEVGLGVGREVGIMFGAAGGLLGAILAAIILLVVRVARSRAANPANPPPARRGWLIPLIGLALGAVAATLIATLGAQVGYFQFLVPYNAQIPDVAPDTTSINNVWFGLGMFAVGGALIGYLLGLQWALSREQGVRRQSLWLGAGMIVTVLCGLSIGLSHRYVGGPFLTIRQVAIDPVATTRGLLVGLAGGLILGILLLILPRLTRSQARWQRVAGLTAALVAGVLVATTAFWFSSIFAIDIY